MVTMPDRIAAYTRLLCALGAMLLPVSLATLAYSPHGLWLGSVLLGVSYSVVPAVMWPLSARVVPAARYGTALGLMWVVQNAGIAGANLAAGWLNDWAGASALNPEGYEPMMRFFGISSLFGFVFALVLWLVAGRRRHELAPTRSSLSPKVPASA